jgi:hypothetical protein
MTKRKKIKKSKALICSTNHIKSQINALIFVRATLSFVLNE